MKSRLLVILMLMVVNTSNAARKLGYVSIALNNYITAKPVTGFPKLFYSQFHPGITFSTGFNWSEKDRHNWTQSFKAGVFNHRYIQTSIVLYTEFGYRYKLKKWGFTAAAGAGYLHMIPGDQQFKQDDNGDWHQVKVPSRPQAMFSFTLGIDRSVGVKGNKMFIRYQNLLQTPFIPGYVPLLPYNVFHFGIAMPLSNLRKGGKDAK